MNSSEGKEIINVRVEELDTKMRSKDDVDMVLRQCCKLKILQNLL